jgi:hypothetical protein
VPTVPRERRGRPVFHAADAALAASFDPDPGAGASLAPLRM